MLTSRVRKLSPHARLLYWVRERESIRLKKEAGEPAPWTDDEILRTYRFCNVRRMDDKVSRWLLKNWYEPYRDHPKMLLAVAMGRFFNLPQSLVGVSAFLFEDGPINWRYVTNYMKSARENEGRVFNGAYVVSTSGNKADKVEWVVNRYVAPLEHVKVYTNTMRECHARIAQEYGFSSFMAGQVVADLRWAVTGNWQDRNQWAPVGPGSKRGMNRLHSRPPETPLTQDQFIEELRDLVEYADGNIPVELYDKLEMMDWQNVCCEFDKYERVLWGEGKPKQLYRAGGGT